MNKCFSTSITPTQSSSAAPPSTIIIILTLFLISLILFQLFSSHILIRVTSKFTWSGAVSVINTSPPILVDDRNIVFGIDLNSVIVSWAVVPIIFHSN